MPLTPLEIHNKEFGTRMRGYDQDEVNEFLDQIIRDYELLIRQNKEVNDELEIANKKLSNYEEMQESLNKSILVAQDAADRLKENTEREIEVTKLEAEKYAENIRTEADEYAAEVNKKADEYAESVHKEADMASVCQKQPQIYKKILTEKECQVYKKHSEKRKLDFLAGRYAVKEAFSKAMGTGIGKTVTFQNISILNDEKGPLGQVVKTSPFHGGITG